MIYAILLLGALLFGGPLGIIVAVAVCLFDEVEA